MIQPHSDDPDVELAARQSYDIVQHVLTQLPRAEAFDYGGHYLQIGEYEVCAQCTAAIAEAQQAEKALQTKVESINDEGIKEHLQLAAHFFKLEAETAIIRAEFHNGFGTEKILNALLGFIAERQIHDDYSHSHHKGA
jgi:hypothetical protein